MEISRSNEGLELSNLDPFFVEILRRIPTSAEPGDSHAARERLFPAPSNDPEANEDWKTYVQPELRHVFESANETVQRDLEQLAETPNSGAGVPGGGGECALRIPAEHFDQWLSSLNQARLATAARHGFTEKELERSSVGAMETSRDLNLFQIHFYGFLQECIVSELNG